MDSSYLISSVAVYPFTAFNSSEPSSCQQAPIHTANALQAPSQSMTAEALLPHLTAPLRCTEFVGRQD